MIRHGECTAFLCEIIIDNRRPHIRETALITAANFRHGAVVEILLDSGANSSLRDSSGKNALSIAAHLGDKESVDILLKDRKNGLSSIAREDLQLLGSDFLN